MSPPTAPSSLMSLPTAPTNRMSEKDIKHCTALVHGLGLSVIIPLISLNEMFLLWDAGRKDADGNEIEITLDDEDHGGEDDNSTVRYTTEEDYDKRVKRISSHYSKLGVDLIFERCQKLKGHLEHEYDSDLVHKVLPQSPALATSQRSNLRQPPPQMSNVVSQTRATHTCNIGQDILSYLEPLEAPSLGITVPAKLLKSSRGLNHPATARFLIPRRHLDEFEQAPVPTIKKFVDGDSPDYLLVAEEWPTFLYDELSGWSSSNVSKGLFRGHVLARTAINNKKIGEPFNPKTSQSQGQPPFLKQFAIKRVTPHMVAYAAVQTYIGLSSVGWGDKDGTFSLIHFYHLIIKTLSDNSDEWVVETLAWWQRKLFGDGCRDPVEPAKALCLTKRTTYKLMEEQRRRQEEDGVSHDDEDAQPEPTYPRWIQRSAGHAQDRQINSDSGNHNTNHQGDQTRDSHTGGQVTGQQDTNDEGIRNDQGTSGTNNTTTQVQDHDRAGGRAEGLPPSTRQPPTPLPPASRPPPPQTPSPQPPSPRLSIPPPPPSNTRGDGTTPPTPEVPGRRRTRDDSADIEQDGSNPQKCQCLEPLGGSANSEANGIEPTPPQVKKGKGGKAKGTKKKTTTANPRTTIPRNTKKGGKA